MSTWNDIQKARARLAEAEFNQQRISAARKVIHPNLNCGTRFNGDYNIPIPPVIYSMLTTLLEEHNRKSIRDARISLAAACHEFNIETLSPSSGAKPD